MALVKKDKPVSELIATCQSQLDIFLQKKTNSFVKLLFEVLSSGEYDADLKAKRAAAKSAPPATREPPPPVIPMSRASESNSGSSVSSHGDVDMRTGRPGAVVQPLMVGNGGPAEDKDGRRVDEYRPGHDAFQHGDSQLRRDWKRRSPLRTGSPSGSANIRPLMSGSSRSSHADRLDRRQHSDTDVQKTRYSPAPYRGNTRPSDGRRRSRSRSRSRPTTRRRSRSPSVSSHSSSSSLPSKRRRVSGGSPGRGNVPVSGNRCRDYDERGYCVRGDLCPYDHGVDPVVLDNVGLPASVLGLPGESSGRHVESSALSHSVADTAPSMMYHPGLPTPYLPPLPPPGETSNPTPLPS